MTQPLRRRRAVSQDRIGAEFQRRQLDRLIQEGALTPHIRSERAVQKTFLDFPPGVRSQYTEWLDKSGVRIIGTHRYVDAEGNPLTNHDPKLIVVDDEEWFV